MRFVRKFLEFNEKLMEFEQFLVLSCDHNRDRNYNLRQKNQLLLLRE